MGTKKMKTINNITFVIILITFSSIVDCARLKTNELSNASDKPKKVWNKDLNGTTNANGTFEYAVKGGSEENWQLEAMRQSRIEEMTEKALVQIKKIPKDNNWIKFVMDIGKRFNALKNKKGATADDWELLCYEEKERTRRLDGVKTAVGRGGKCMFLAKRVMNRINLLANAKNKKKDSWQMIGLYMKKHAKTCGKPRVIKPKGPLNIAAIYNARCKKTKATFY